MFKGTVTREFDYTTTAGKVCHLKFSRFASQIEKHLFAIDVRVNAPKGTEVKVCTTLKALEGTNISKKEEIGAEMTNPFTLNVCGFDGEESYIDYKTNVSKFGIACAVSESCTLEKTQTESGETFAKTTYTGTSNGEEIRYSRYCAFATTRDTAEYKQLVVDVVRKAKASGYDVLNAQSEEYWRDYWDTSDICIDGDDLVQQGIRFGLFMINQSAGKDGKTLVFENASGEKIFVKSVKGIHANPYLEQAYTENSERLVSSFGDELATAVEKFVSKNFRPVQ